MIVLYDFFVLFLMDLVLYLMHPLWMASTTYRNGRLPSIAIPRTPRDKRMWRLIFDKNPLFRMFVTDKIATKLWMQNHSSGLFVAPVVWSGRDVAELPDAILAQKVVIKANNGSSQNIFLYSAPAERGAIDAILRKWLQSSYGEQYGTQYWPKVEQVVFAEKILAGPDYLMRCETGVE